MKKKQTKITRKEAIKKFGKYAAMTAVGTFIVLNPQKVLRNLLLTRLGIVNSSL